PETDYFGSGLTLDFKNASLALRDDSGILDGAVTLNKDAALPQNDAQRRDDMTKLGGKIC
ncbi:iron-sulfur cluster biosynthesis family protein, partial [Lacticaseibacillus paracasei]